MIRMLIFYLVRIIVVSIAVYLVLALIRGIIRALQGDKQPFAGKFRRSPGQEYPPKKKEDYKDVKDAKFIEFPKEQPGKNQDQQT